MWPSVPETSGPMLLSVQASARELGIGRDTAYQLVRNGRLRSVTVGRRRLIPRTELAAFVERESLVGIADAEARS